MINRNIEKELLEISKEYKIVTILGPRQSGKTTLVQKCFKTYTYVNLENPEIRDFAVSDPNAFFKEYPTPLIIDEIQRVPKLLSFIQILSDKSDVFGEYILTGSHQSKLNNEITQSLAGRTAILKLLPFSIDELLNTNYDLSWEEYAFNGFMPRVYDKKMKVTRFYSNYFQTYIERDLKTIANIKNLSSFNIFIRLLAGRIGQVINLSSLSNDVGVSSSTLKEWLSILEASFIIYKLQPFHENSRKQLIKSPKLFFYDTGLLCYLLGINSPTQVLRDPLRGNIFENMIVIDILKYIYNTGSFLSIFFTQDKHRNEVDLIIKQGRNLIPIEIKSSQTYNKKFIKNIEHFMKNRDDSVKPGFVIYAGDLEPKINNISFINYKKIKKISHKQTE